MTPFSKILLTLSVVQLTLFKCCHDLELIIFKLVSSINLKSFSSEIALRWMPQDLTDD